jgi:hypothetical protein
MALSAVSTRSKPTSTPTTPAASRNAKDVPTKSWPIVRGSPDPTTAATPRAGACGLVSAATGVTAREASVTVMYAP